MKNELSTDFTHALGTNEIANELPLPEEFHNDEIEHNDDVYPMEPEVELSEMNADYNIEHTDYNDEHTDYNTENADYDIDNTDCNVADYKTENSDMKPAIKQEVEDYDEFEDTGEFDFDEDAQIPNEDMDYEPILDYGNAENVIVKQEGDESMFESGEGTIKLSDDKYRVNS